MFIVNSNRCRGATGTCKMRTNCHVDGSGAYRYETTAVDMSRLCGPRAARYRRCTNAATGVGTPPLPACVADRTWSRGGEPAPRSQTGNAPQIEAAHRRGSRSRVRGRGRSRIQRRPGNVFELQPDEVPSHRRGRRRRDRSAHRAPLSRPISMRPEGAGAAKGGAPGSAEPSPAPAVTSSLGLLMDLDGTSW